MAVANSRPGTYCQLVSEEMDIFSPSEEKQKKTHAQPITNSTGPPLGHHQGLSMTVNSSLQKDMDKKSGNDTGRQRITS